MVFVVMMTRSMVRRVRLTPTQLPLAAAGARRPLNLRRICDPLFETGTMYRRLHLAPPEAIASRLVLQARSPPELE